MVAAALEQPALVVPGSRTNIGFISHDWSVFSPVQPLSVNATNRKLILGAKVYDARALTQTLGII